MPTRRLRVASLLLVGGAAVGGCTATGAGSGAAGSVSPANATIDWKTAAYTAAGCSSRADWLAAGWAADDWDAATVTTTQADVTGDGISDLLVLLACPSAVSELPQAVVAFDISAGEPSELGVLGADLGLQDATIAANGNSVALSGPAVSGGDPTCCAGHWASETFTWSGTGFTSDGPLVVLGTRPPVPGTLDDGEHVGMIRAVSDDTVYVDLVEWFEDSAAAQACAEDGVADNGWEQCNSYYVRDADDAVSMLPVASGARASYIDEYSARPVAVASAGALAGTPAVSDDVDEHHYVRLTVAGGQVIRLAEIFVP